jgi:UDP:flavonoid glycosyltransferase YjiC (YdhE family)
MPDRRVLYVSGSIGLGHVKRDLSIAAELRRRDPGIEVVWLAGGSAAQVLSEAGEMLVPESRDYRDETEVAEASAGEGALSLTRYVYRALARWLHNARVIRRAAQREHIDVLVGNETYEVIVAHVLGLRILPPAPFVMMYDFWGMDVTSGGLFERLGAWILNFIWVQERRVTTRGRNAAIFIGEPEDIPARRFGMFLPNRRNHAEDHVEFVGYVLTFPRDDLGDRDVVRDELGYGPGPVVVCAVGGTSIGRRLLEVCGAAFPLVAAQVPDLQMLLVCGPRIDPESVNVPGGVEVRGMVSDLWRHFFACDLAVVQAGGTTTLELEALQVPFLYFPIEGHAEQELTVAARLERHGAGRRMSTSTTSKDALAKAMVEALDQGARYSAIPLDGAERAASIILERAGWSAPAKPAPGPAPRPGRNRREGEES